MREKAGLGRLWSNSLWGIKKTDRYIVIYFFARKAKTWIKSPLSEIPDEDHIPRHPAT